MANILIDVGHPAHVHLFRGAARDWTAARHQVLFTALDREIILDFSRRSPAHRVT
jgi:predicted glycosyltransferase